MTDGQKIATALGVSERTVQRWHESSIITIGWNGDRKHFYRCNLTKRALDLLRRQRVRESQLLKSLYEYSARDSETILDMGSRLMHANTKIRQLEKENAELAVALNQAAERS